MALRCTKPVERQEEVNELLTHGLSTHTAIPIPPPTQSAAMPLCWLVRFKAWRRVTNMRAPEAPIGWPMAIAPPLTLTCRKTWKRSERNMFWKFNCIVIYRIIIPLNDNQFNKVNIWPCQIYQGNKHTLIKLDYKIGMNPQNHCQCVKINRKLYISICT